MGGLVGSITLDIPFGSEPLLFDFQLPNYQFSERYSRLRRDQNPRN